MLSEINTDPKNRPVIEEFADQILELCDRFGKSDQSGGSAPFVVGALASAIKKLCLQEPICPITGIDVEWNDIAEMNGGVSMYQNNRCSAIFKHGKEDRAYYIDAIVFKSQDGNTFTSMGGVEGIGSAQYIRSFPFDPKTFYIDVISTEIRKDDWEHKIKNWAQITLAFMYYRQKNIA